VREEGTRKQEGERAGREREGRRAGNLRYKRGRGPGERERAGEQEVCDTSHCLHAGVGILVVVEPGRDLPWRLLNGTHECISVQPIYECWSDAT